MNEVNKTLFIPLYGKAYVSKHNIILNDPDAERIWSAEGFSLRGKAKSKWLAYNMAMRARVFDDWTDLQLDANEHALVIHIGCGLDSRCNRIKKNYDLWLDCDLPEVIEVRRKYYNDTNNYRMLSLDAADSEQLQALPDGKTAIIVLEGLSMYLSMEQLRQMFKILEEKYDRLHILMDIYTEFGAKASKYKNPVNEVGVTTLYGFDNVEELLQGMKIVFQKEHSFTPKYLVDELTGFERKFFNILFTGSFYGKLYRLLEFSLSK